jgi:hypothetical protein
MYIVEISTGTKHQVEVAPVEDADFVTLGKKRYFFNWENEREFKIYKLHIVGSNEVLGLISLERIPDEWRVHIRLLTVSRENRGKKKKYKNIAGNLLTHAAKIAIANYAELACISLRPKSEIAQHYITKYHMVITGVTLSLEVPEILNLINLYDHD